jgi:hypothetical protein
MFTIPYYHYNIKEWSQFKQEILSSLKVKNPERVPEHVKVTMTTDYWDDYNPDDYKKFIEMVKPYLFEVPDISIITRVWFQTSTKNQYHGVHTHGALGWSAVFYADFDKTIHIPTTFYCPYHDVKGEIKDFCPDAEEGDIVIFPSFLLHEGPVNTSDVPRTIISFNFM